MRLSRQERHHKRHLLPGGLSQRASNPLNAVPGVLTFALVLDDAKYIRLAKVGCGASSAFVGPGSSASVVKGGGGCQGGELVAKSTRVRFTCSSAWAGRWADGLACCTHSLHIECELLHTGKTDKRIVQVRIEIVECYPALDLCGARPETLADCSYPGVWIQVFGANRKLGCSDLPRKLNLRKKRS